MMREVVRTLKAMTQEERRSNQDWVELVPAVLWALNAALRERYGSTSYHVMFGRAPRTALFTLTGQEWQVHVMNDKALRKKVQSVVEVQSQLHKEVLDKVNASCGMQRVAASRGNLPSFAVSEYVLAIRVRLSLIHI